MTFWEKILSWGWDASNGALVSIQEDHVGLAGKQETIVPEEAYFDIRVSEMFLAKPRKLTKQWYPTIHAIIRFRHAGEQQEIVRVLGPEPFLALDPDVGHRVIVENQQVLSPIPYRGGDIDLMIGLLKIEAHDYAPTLLKVLSTLTQVASFYFVGPWNTIATSALEGIENLLNVNKQNLEMAFNISFEEPNSSVSRPLTSGYSAFINIEDRTTDLANRLWVKNGHLYEDNPDDGGKRYSEHDYVLFRIGRRTERGNGWRNSPEFYNAWKTVLELAYGGKSDELKASKYTLKRRILLSPNLIDRDKWAYMKAVDDEIPPPRSLSIVGQEIEERFDDRVYELLAERDDRPSTDELSELVND